MAKRIDIDVVAHDYASSTYKNIIHATASMTGSVNSSLIKFGDGLRSYNNSMYNFNRVAQRVFKELGNSAYKFTSDAIKNFSDLEQQHAKTMGAMANNYDKTAESQKKFFEDQQKLRSNAIRLGITGPTGNGSLFTAQEYAYAQTSLIKAGKTAPEVVNSGAVETVAKFAGGNDLDLDTATSFAVTMGTQFEVGMENWGDMLDKVTRAADISVIDVPDIIESLKYAGGIASGLGRPIEEVLGAIAVMGNAGLKGSMAGTGLQSFLTRILSSGDLGDTALGNAPGIAGDMFNAFRAEALDSFGNMKDLEDITPILDDAMSSLDDEEQAWFAKKLFGLFQMKAAYALKRTGPAGENLLADTIGQIKDTSGGTNANKWALMMSSQYGRLEALQNTWGGVKTDFGERISPAVMAVADEIYEFLSNNGNYSIDFGKLKKSIEESGDNISEQYGTELGKAISNLGSMGIDGARIGAAVAPTGVGVANFTMKLLNGDIKGAFDSLDKSIQDSVKNINELPPELQDLAKSANNAMLALLALAGINIGTKILETVGSVWKYTGGAIINAASSKITSGVTNVTSPTSNVNVGTATMSTPVMNVTAAVVNMTGGVGSAAKSAASSAAGGALGGAMAGGATAAGGAPVFKALVDKGAAAGNAPINMYKNPLTGTYVSGGTMLAGASKIAGTTAVAAGLTLGLTGSQNVSKSGTTAGREAMDKKFLELDGLSKTDNGAKWYELFRSNTPEYYQQQTKRQQTLVDTIPNSYQKSKNDYFNNIDFFKNYEVGKNYVGGLADSYYVNKTQAGVPVSKEEYMQFMDSLVDKMASVIQKEKITKIDPNNVNTIPGMSELMTYVKNFGTDKQEKVLETTTTVTAPKIALYPTLNVDVRVDQNGNKVSQNVTQIGNFDGVYAWYYKQSARYGK